MIHGIVKTEHATPVMADKHDVLESHPADKPFNIRIVFQKSTGDMRSADFSNPTRSKAMHLPNDDTAGMIFLQRYDQVGFP